MIISFQNFKGGVGKTTLTLNCAWAFAELGRKVLVVDADPQRSALDWLACRETLAPFHLVGFDRPTLHRDIPGLMDGRDLAIIDGPPRVTDIARSAILASDLVVVPLQPSPYDVWASQETLKIIRESSVYNENRQSVIAVNREIVRTVISRSVGQALKATGIPVLAARVRQRVIFAESATRGETVFESSPDGPAAHEVRRLTREIGEWLQKT